MNHNLDNITNICFELEGLLSLVKERKELLSKVKPMMQQKAQAILTLLTEMNPEIKSELLTETDVAEKEVIIPKTDGIEEADSDYEDLGSTNFAKTSNAEASCSRNLRQFFTINDKFRFRRELFGNSDIEFSDCINLVSAMSSYSEAKDYFLIDLGWDADNEEVVEFMSIIETFFK